MIVFHIFDHIIKGGGWGGTLFSISAEEGIYSQGNSLALAGLCV